MQLVKDKILELSELKTFVDDIINGTRWLKFLFSRVVQKNILANFVLSSATANALNLDQSGKVLRYKILKCEML